jgi:GTP-binding protein EngB required for normal cell division
MNTNNSKAKINILLVGNSGVGKSSLCRVFSSTLGFSFGIGLSRRATVVEIATDNCIYSIIDAPRFYEEGDDRATYRNTAEIAKILSLSASSTPFIVCFVICLDSSEYVKQNDLGMMRVVKQCFEQQGSRNVKFSLVINRLSERGFTAFTEHAPYRQSLLNLFRNEAGVAITEDDILLINDRFLQFPKEQQQGLLTDYVKKFEAGHGSYYDQILHQIDQFNTTGTDAFLTGYNLYQQQYQKQLESMLSSQISSQNQSYGVPWTAAIEQIKQQQQQMVASILAGGPANGVAANPYMNFNTFGNNSPQNPYLPSYMNQQQQQQQQQQQFYNTEFQQPQTSGTNQAFGAAGAFMSGIIGTPGADPSNNGAIYNAAGQFVGGAVMSGCTIM